jgi:hypothetical protein
MYFPDENISKNMNQKDIDAIFEDTNYVNPDEENIFLLKRGRKIMNSNLL